MTKEFLIHEKSAPFKTFKALIENKEVRTAKKEVILFGEKVLLEFKNELVALITTEAGKDHPAFSHLDRYILTPKAFKALSGLITPEPYAALVKLPKRDPNLTIHHGVLVVDALNDPGNLGTLFRTAWGLGLDALIVTPHTVDPYHEKVLRASKGISVKMPWLKLKKEELEPFFKNHRLSVYLADLEGSPLHEIKPESPFALILGNESQGLSPELKKLGQSLHIPQKNLESFNVAIAGAIISYTLLQGASHGQ